MSMLLLSECNNYSETDLNQGQMWNLPYLYQHNVVKTIKLICRSIFFIIRYIHFKKTRNDTSDLYLENRVNDLELKKQILHQRGSPPPLVM